MFYVVYNGYHCFINGTTIHQIGHYFNIPLQYFYLVCRGKLKQFGCQNDIIDLIIRAHGGGGKGGFGALLKGKDQKEKKPEELPADYYDMSKDLNGERLYRARIIKEQNEIKQQNELLKIQAEIERKEVNEKIQQQKELAIIDTQERVDLMKKQLSDVNVLSCKRLPEHGNKKKYVDGVGQILVGSSSPPKPLSNDIQCEENKESDSTDSLDFLNPF